MPSNKDPTIELNEEALDYLFAQLENYLNFIEEDLGYFPYMEVIASLFFFATLIAKSNSLTQKEYLILAKKIFASEITKSEVPQGELN